MKANERNNEKERMGLVDSCREYLEGCRSLALGACEEAFVSLFRDGGFRVMEAKEIGLPVYSFTYTGETIRPTSDMSIPDFMLLIAGPMIDLPGEGNRGVFYNMAYDIVHSAATDTLDELLKEYIVNAEKSGMFKEELRELRELYQKISTTDGKEPFWDFVFEQFGDDVVIDSFNMDRTDFACLKENTLTVAELYQKCRKIRHLRKRTE